VAESWLSRHNLIVPEWSKRPDLWREAFALVEESPRSLRRVSSITTINSSISCGEEVGSRVSSIGSLDPLARQESTSHTFDSISACSIQVHSLNSFSISMKRRREDVERWWDVEGLLKYLPGWGGFLQQQAGRRLSVDFEGMHARVEATLASRFDVTDDGRTIR